MFARAREGDTGRGHASRLGDWLTCWMTWGIVSIDEGTNTGMTYLDGAGYKRNGL